MPASAEDGWAWFDGAPGRDADTDVRRCFVRAFNTGAGREVLAHLRAATIERRTPSEASDGFLRHLGGSVKVPDATFRLAMGVPETPGSYELQLDDDGLDADPEVNRRLHDAGFTQSQAQLVYDLAREYIGPMVQQTAADFEAERQTERLQKQFGGAEAWTGVSRQIQEWGKANLASAAISTTYERCIALHQMMQSHEPGLVRNSAPAERNGADELKAMMRDPRYWRERDPAFIRQVTDGFSRLYADGES